MLVRCVIDYKVDDDANAADMALVEEFLEIIDSAEFGAHVAIIDDVVAVVDHGRREVWQYVEAVDAECSEIIEAANEALQVTCKRIYVELVYPRVFPPVLFVGHGLFRILYYRQCIKYTNDMSKVTPSLTLKNILYTAIVLVVVGTGIWWFFFRTVGQSPYMLAVVRRGSITQEALASGRVQSPTTIHLHFRGSGKIVSLRAQVSQSVRAGDVLATQDTGVLLAQRAQALSAVNAATAALRKAQAGATPQSIAVSRAQLAVAQQALQNSYTTVANTLADAYAKGNDAVVNQLALFFSNAQSQNPQLTFSISDAQVATNIVTERLQTGADLSAWQGEIAEVAGVTDPGQLDRIMSQANTHLASIQALLNTSITAVSDNISLSTANATTYRTNAAAGLTEVNTALAAIKTLQQAIASQKAAIAQAQAQLDLTTASTTVNDLDVAQAQVEQVQAAVAVIDAQIRDLEIVAPVAGIVTDTIGTVGEIVGPDVNVVNLMPQNALEVKVNVSEDNVVGVRVGNRVRIKLDAFPGAMDFAGTVSEVDPAETIIGGAVYYQTAIVFAQHYDGVKSGMTANVWIDTGSASSTLLIPASALSRTDGGVSVQVIEQGKPVSHPVSVGLKDQNGMVQILSGLSEGQQVVTGSK